MSHTRHDIRTLYGGSITEREYLPAQSQLHRVRKESMGNSSSRNGDGSIRYDVEQDHSSMQLKKTFGFDDEDFFIPPDPYLDALWRKADPQKWDVLVKQIMEAAEARSVELRLETEPFKSIPSCIGLCCALHKLSVSGDLLTLPPTIGNLKHLSYLATYCSFVHFYPYEMKHLYYKRLSKVFGSCLYIDMKSLYGRHPFPRLGITERPPFQKGYFTDLLQHRSTADEQILPVVQAILPPALAQIVMSYVPNVCFSCSNCCRSVAYASLSDAAAPNYTAWVQFQWGGDHRAFMPLLARCCSDVCLEQVRKEVQEHQKSNQVRPNGYSRPMLSPEEGPQPPHDSVFQEDKAVAVDTLLRYIGALSQGSPASSDQKDESD